MDKLSLPDFKTVVKSAPLVSIDLVVENGSNEYLLGWRSNAPAKDHWFVPGGRIYKDERFEKAFERITLAELGLTVPLSSARFLGVFEHIYPGDNFLQDPGFGTHYVVHAFKVQLSGQLNLPLEQHQKYWWAKLEDIIDNPEVHLNSKNYFNGHQPFSD